MKIKVSEKDVQTSCLQYLFFQKDVFFFRLNNIPVYNEGQFRRLPAYTPKGLPDCIVIKDGKFIALEFKGSTGKLSGDQQAVKFLINKAGGQHYTIRSIEDLKVVGL